MTADLRARVLHEHAELRCLMGDVDLAAGAVLSGVHGAAAHLQSHVARLGTALLDHLAFEERHLVPAVRSRSPARADAVLREHGRQRDVLHELRVMRGDHDARALAGRLPALVGELLLDMACEERDLLDALGASPPETAEAP